MLVMSLTIIFISRFSVDKVSELKRSMSFLTFKK